MSRIALFGADLFPLDDWADDVLGGLGGIAGDVVRNGFEFIVQTLFGGDAAELTLGILRWLVAIPNLTAGDVRELSETTTVIALGLLAALATLAVARFWLADLSPGEGAGGFGAIQGVVRAVAAAAAIAAWPFAFDLLLRLAGALPRAMLSSGEMRENVAELLSEGVALGALLSWTGVPLFFGIAIAVVGMLFVLALVAVKIIVTALTIVVFLAMPIALCLWIVPELGWVVRLCFGALLGALAIPAVWALLFGAFGAMWSDTILLQNNGKGSQVGIAGSLANAAIVKPMVAIALMYLALAVPKRMVGMAMSASGGGLVRGVAGSYASQAVLQRMAPGSGALAGGAMRGGVSQPSGTASAPHRSAGGGGRAGGAAAQGNPAASGARGAQQAVGGTAQAAGSAGVTGVAATQAARGGAAATASPRATVAAPPELDRYGGPRHSMTPERLAARRAALAAMERSSGPRPDATSVAEAHRGLPPGLREPVARALHGEQSERGARAVLAGYAADPSGEPARSELIAIGRAERATWRAAIPRPAAAAPPSATQQQLPGTEAPSSPAAALPAGRPAPRQSEEARRALGPAPGVSSQPPPAEPGPTGPAGERGLPAKPERPRPASGTGPERPAPPDPDDDGPRRRPRA